MTDEELIQKALALKKEEDKELAKLLKLAGFLFVDELVKQILEIEDSLDEILQNDYEQSAELAEELASKNKKPLKTVIILALSARIFKSEMAKKVNPKLKLSFLTLYEKFNGKYKGDEPHNPKSRHFKEIERWLKNLPKLMDLTTKNNLVNLIQKSYEDGKGVKWLERELVKLSEFSRSRARTTSITEVLRMYSGSQYESMMNNPNIVGKEWRHTSGIKEPREAHGKADGEIISKDDYFIIDGERCRYPRDPKLSPGNSIQCHCFMNPVLADKYTK